MKWALKEYWMEEFNQGIIQSDNNPDIIMWVASDCIKDCYKNGFLTGFVIAGMFSMTSVWVLYKLTHKKKKVKGGKEDE